MSLFFTFVLQLVAFRIGTARLAKLGIIDSTNTGNKSTPITPKNNDDEITAATPSTEQEKSDIDQAERGSVTTSSDSTLFNDSEEANPAAAQILSVAILEFGVVFHSIIIGLTLAVSGPSQFVILFIVIIFHQM